MRRLALVFALVTASVAATARAGSAEPPPSQTDGGDDGSAEPALPTVQLVQAWPKTKQALLYDPIQGTYVVVAAGQNVDGFRVSRIGKNQIVLSTTTGPTRDYVLLPTPVADLPDAPATPGPGVGGASAGSGSAAATTPATTAPATTTPPATTPGLVDPYPAGMLDPYGTEGVRVVEAPPGSKADGTATTTPATTAPAITTPATGAPATGAPATTTTTPGAKVPGAPATTTTAKAPTPAATAKAPTPPGTATAPTVTTTAKAPTPATTAKAPTPATTAKAPTPATTAKAPPTPAAAKVPPTTTTPPATAAGNAAVIARKDLDAALADFGTLTKDTRLTLGPSGVAFSHVAPGSLFAKVGLRDGDRVITVNGAPIRSLDDAADLYAQLSGVHQLVLDVVRGAVHVSLRAELR